MTCQNQAYQKVCGGIHSRLPCCGEIYKSHFSSSPLGARDEVCIVEVFELAKPATENRLVEFRSHGTCMYPCLRQGDILQIEPRTAGEIRIGDIVVFRRSNYLYAHRAVDKGKYGSVSYIVTRADRPGGGSDGPSFDEDILGVVSNATRRGVKLNLGKKDDTYGGKAFFNLYLKWYIFKKRLFEKAIDIILYTQQIKIYKKIAGFLFSGLRKKINIYIRGPMSFKITSRFYQDISQEDLKLSISEALEHQALATWSMVAHMRSRFVGTLSFVYKPENCPFSGWWLSDPGVRIRYRGMGIEERLFKESDAILNELKVKEVFVSFGKKKRLNRLVFGNLGFKETSAYGDKFNNIEKGSTKRPVIMQRRIV